MAINNKTPTLRKGLTVEDLAQGSHLGRYAAQGITHGTLSAKAMRAAIQVLIDGVNAGDRITKRDVISFFTTLDMFSKDLRDTIRTRMDKGELRATLLDKLIQ